jgi:hypothetical protein
MFRQEFIGTARACIGGGRITVIAFYPDQARDELRPQHPAAPRAFFLYLPQNGRGRLRRILISERSENVIDADDDIDTADFRMARHENSPLV